MENNGTKQAFILSFKRRNYFRDDIRALMISSAIENLKEANYFRPSKGAPTGFSHKMWTFLNMGMELRPRKATGNDYNASCPKPSISECIICQDAEATHKFLPCNHELLCAPCLKKYEKKFGNDPDCPMCRTPSTEIVEVVRFRRNQKPFGFNN